MFKYFVGGQNRVWWRV